MSEEKKVAKTKEQGIVTFDESLFEQDANLGMENVGQEDLALPFLKVDKDTGEITNSVTGDTYPVEAKVKILPCAYQRRFLEWTPRGVGGSAPVNIYTPSQERPETKRDAANMDWVVGGDTYIEENGQHFVLVIDPETGLGSPALIAMKRTALKKSRKFNSMVASRVMKGKNGAFTPPRFSHTYFLQSSKESNQKGDWFGWEITLDEVVQDAELYTQAKSFAESIMKGEVEVKHSAEGADSSTEDVPF